MAEKNLRTEVTELAQRCNELADTLAHDAAVLFEMRPGSGGSDLLNGYSQANHSFAQALHRILNDTDH